MMKFLKRLTTAGQRMRIAFPRVFAVLGSTRTGIGGFLLSALILAAASSGAYLLFPAEPRLVHAEGAKEINVPVTTSLIVHFDRPVSTRDLSVRLYPEVPGTWKKGTGYFTTQAVFVPEKRFEAGKEYKVVLLGVRNAFSKLRTPQRELTFVTERAAKLMSAPGLKEPQTNFQINDQLLLSFSAPPQRTRDLAVRTEPEVKTLMRYDGSTVRVRFKEPLRQGTTYHYTVLDSSLSTEDKAIARGTVVTVFPPRIKSMGPLGDHIRLTTSVTIEFEEAMDRGSVEANFALSGVEGSPSWADDHRFTFTPKGLSHETSYRYVLKQGTKTAAGGVLESDITGAFATIGAVRVIGASPGSGSTWVSVQRRLSVTFDQEVDRGSAQSRFSVSPSVPGSFAWDGNTMTFIPAQNYSYGTAYTYRVAAGVVGIYGLPMRGTFAATFTTQLAVVKLNVPVYYQSYALSCEESSARAALAYFGVYVSDWDVLMRVGYSPRNRDFSTNSWDNPNQMFVGYVTGRQNTTGYGVHPPPIAAAVRSFGRNAYTFGGWSASRLAQEIAAGHPVIIWGVYGAGTADGWNTPSGWVSAPKGEHTRVVVGFYGTPDNPTSFILNDPLAGQVTWSTAALLGNWGWFGNSGVVVY